MLAHLQDLVFLSAAGRALHCRRLRHDESAGGHKHEIATTCHAARSHLTRFSVYVYDEILRKKRGGYGDGLCNYGSGIEKQAG